MASWNDIKKRQVLEFLKAEINDEIIHFGKFSNQEQDSRNVVSAKPSDLPLFYDLNFQILEYLKPHLPLRTTITLDKIEPEGIALANHLKIEGHSIRIQSWPYI